MRFSESSRAHGERASRETVAEARRLYETTDLAQAEIGRRLGMLGSSISRMAQRNGWLRAAATADRRALVGSIRAKVDAEIAKVEDILGGGAARADVGGSARTLASLVRTLRELAKYDEDRSRAASRRIEPDARGRNHERDGGRHEERHDAVADLDALRDALADRLERLRREREAG